MVAAGMLTVLSACLCSPWACTAPDDPAETAAPGGGAGPPTSGGG